jgi:hypothetical protein
MITTLLVVTLAASTAGAAAVPDEVGLQCNIGPATTQLGGNDWLMYGCADGHSLVIVAAPPNPASPFVFIATPDSNGGIELHGEGTGAKSATEPAYERLRALSSAELAGLYLHAEQAAGE